MWGLIMKYEKCCVCGKRLYGRAKNKRYCKDCEPKHSITFKLNDREYAKLLEYYDIFGCDSITMCVKDLVLEGVKQ